MLSNIDPQMSDGLAFFKFQGTGGTVAGVGHYLKSMSQDVLVAIADPEGSGLYNKVSIRST